ncbi:MAG: PRC-barrel domain-containing protein [Usitatibacter sp.]
MSPARAHVARIVAAETLGGARVVDRHGNALGAIEDLVIEPGGRIAYAVMSASPTAARFAVPWSALSRDEARRCFVLDDEDSGP